MQKFWMILLLGMLVVAGCLVSLACEQKPQQSNESYTEPAPAFGEKRASKSSSALSAQEVMDKIISLIKKGDVFAAEEFMTERARNMRISRDFGSLSSTEALEELVKWYGYDKEIHKKVEVAGSTTKIEYLIVLRKNDFGGAYKLNFFFKQESGRWMLDRITEDDHLTLKSIS